MLLGLRSLWEVVVSAGQSAGDLFRRPIARVRFTIHRFLGQLDTDAVTLSSELVRRRIHSHTAALVGEALELFAMIVPIRVRVEAFQGWLLDEGVVLESTRIPVRGRASLKADDDIIVLLGEL